jgi:hypothetical protein
MARETYVNQASDRAPAQAAPCGTDELLATHAKTSKAVALSTAR